ncbi:hypothetical protein Kpol_1056p31 [Vanderwaltozyma polyspora DSM 70294]|uniref:Enhancer of mRNA-decapping protein 3 n=1 Tax=Vanderwaltozyma polyspora (strain ATCC 22028 / DSM 70294 / BCRC 21397 / CBS 2163 / NBRC 10782 / NRRL Y-8283 / UCD 57-17) TaxID=436907 RepID=A7TLN8_VANPO|nr:uncharacterized protein Kpol_1056p31 [Vanderwaltozyma polyspora DSM 70294]EDO16830.1 hypothetical protein Kpol_1056p31 [Vanderwaltozyma polyspora DSM 70294]
MSQFFGYGVQVELKDGKLIQGKIVKATSKGLTLSDVKFGDGGTSQAFKVRASRLKDLKVLFVAASGGNSSMSNGGGKKNGSRPQSRQQQGGGGGKIDWEDDDVARIKAQDDFDFEGSLRMFNKKDVFAQLKQNDEISPESRLVSHNKKQRINDDGEAKFDIKELVIPNAKNDAWNELDDVNINTARSNSGGERNVEGDDEEEAEEDDDDDDYEVDDVDNPDFFPITKSINITHLLHTASASSNKTSDNESSTSDNGQEEILTKLGQMLINQTSKGVQKSISPSDVSKSQVLKAKNINLSVPMATPIQLLEIERTATDFFGISSQIVLENYALSASFFIRQKLGGRVRLHSQNSNAEPLVVIMTSDTSRTGPRAIALGRHLCQTNAIRVITVFTGLQEEILDKQVAEQLDIYKKCGGKLVTSVAALENAISKLNSPVEIIIDGIQGFDCTLREIFDSESYYNIKNEGESIKKRTIDLITWANSNQNSRKQIWSLDLPSGYDSGSGLSSEISINSTGILSTGWPLQCLHTIKASMPHLQDIVVVDTATPQGVYKQRNSLRKFQNCDLFVTDGSLSLQI